ncbi:hypothetical protein NQ318_013833 [Aromia moschata]|uniref:Uncharacterized protein n=1 Tax=Aromia moschata TaxID=1265417 RepID=A0AAV8Z8M9_9CUCU|nr:hypothetical protein NQ318_013833 [Aromia moschata]
MAEEVQQSPDELKELGNLSVKEQRFEEAVLHYTHSIKLDPLKLHAVLLALEDANETIKLNPTWPKGYFRKGEVEYATGHYTDAYNSYRKALELKPDDINLVEALNKTAKEILKEQKADQTLPWLGAGIGIVVGVVIVLADCVFTHKPTHPILMAFVTMTIAMVGYGIARLYRYWVKCQRDGLLEPPIDLMGNDASSEPDSGNEGKDAKSHTPRYTKSQARQRYKKGKL